MKFQCGQLEIDTDTSALSHGNKRILRATNNLIKGGVVIDLEKVHPVYMRGSKPLVAYRVYTDRHLAEFDAFVDALYHFQVQCTIHSEY